MKPYAPYAVIGLGVIIMGGIAWWFGSRSEEPAPEPSLPEESIQLSEGLSIYTNGKYGFLIVYPAGAVVAEGFAQNDGEAWRATALADAEGERPVTITTYRAQSEDAYPRSFSAYVRVGTSPDAREVRECLSSRNQQGETELGPVDIEGTTWHRFSFEGAAMMRYVKGESYRTVRNGTCFALEKVAEGSSYREEANAADIPQETLDAAYADLDAVIESFRFAR